jgi:hypothetical protein
MNNINWHTVIEMLVQPGVDITTDPSKWHLDTPGYNEIHTMWQTANFNMSAIKWTNYYPGKHFNNTIVEQVAEHLNVGIHRSWISRIDPGFFAPWHWDVDDNEDEYLQKGNPVRYSCFIEEPAHGHIFIVGDNYYYNQPKGTLIKWDNYKDWHSGINAGMTPKYMFHLLAYQN